MSTNFQFELVSPAKLLMSGEVREVVVPGSEGDFAILAGHAPVISTLRPGLLKITTDEGSEKTFFVHGGFVEAGPTNLMVIAEYAVPSAELTDQLIEQQLKAANETLADPKDNDAACKEASDMIACLDTLKGAA